MTYSHNGFRSPSKVPRSKKVHNHNPNLSLDGRIRANYRRMRRIVSLKILGRKIAYQFRIIINLPIDVLRRRTQFVELCGQKGRFWSISDEISNNFDCSFGSSLQRIFRSHSFCSTSIDFLWAIIHAMLILGC